VSNNNRIVVIVDDDLELTLLFRAALKDISRVKIFTFTDPVLALEHFQINEYAFVLVEVVDKIFRDYAKNKIIDEFLQKPIGMHELIKEVDTQLYSYENQKRLLPKV